MNWSTMLNIKLGIFDDDLLSVINRYYIVVLPALRLLFVVYCVSSCIIISLYTSYISVEFQSGLQ